MFETARTCCELLAVLFSCAVNTFGIGRCSRGAAHKGCALQSQSMPGSMACDQGGTEMAFWKPPKPPFA
eukprot:14533351-Alexandrium_andersonii.AAC.1